MKKILKTEEEWREEMSDLQFYVMRRAGTERPFTGEYTNHDNEGVYCCAACGHELFKSSHKYPSSCGWASFWTELETAHIVQRPDFSHNMVRTELICPVCDSHLGHIFDDSPMPSGKRYCINSICLKFEPILLNPR